MSRGGQLHQPARQAPPPAACERSPPITDRCRRIQVTVADLNAGPQARPGTLLAASVFVPDFSGLLREFSV
jgi:hypothetical protein